MNPLRLRGARTHNLKSIDLDLRPGEVVAIAGVSGAGKSSLALDTLYAEGQRRFVESFSPYARQFLERLERPPTDELDPVPAAVAVERAAPIKSSRSTLSTMADLEPLLAALFLREASPVCPEHNVPAVKHTDVSVAQDWIERRAGQRAIISYKQRVTGREHYLEVRDNLSRDGYRRLFLNERVRSIDEIAPSELDEQSEIEVVVDRAALIPQERSRVAEGVRNGWAKGGGRAYFRFDGETEPNIAAEGSACPVCARELPEAVPGLFSHDSPRGACSTCRGFGRVIGIDWDKVIPDPRKTLKQHAIRPWNGKSTSWERGELKRLCERNGIPLDVPWQQLTAAQHQLVLNGDAKSELAGVVGWFKWLETRTYKMHVRVLLSRYRSYDPCPKCHGTRYSSEALGYRLAGLNIAEWHTREVHAVLASVNQLECQTGQGRLIAAELKARLAFLDRVGLGYLALDRQARTLSGGEAQRVTLTAALGTSLCNALFVIDEPSVGLHPSDVARLGPVVRELAQRNNMVLLVEHDPQLLAAADRLLELGPGPGQGGGQIVFDGPVRDALKRDTATRRAFETEAAAKAQKRTQPPRPAKGWLAVKGAQGHNLKAVSTRVPLGVFCVFAGPSGSGKSSLAVDVVYRSVARHFGETDVEKPLDVESIEGLEQLGQVVLVDQAPLGRTSRGNAATYTKAWDYLRKAFGEQPAAERAQLSASDFSFNVAGGRCEACAGEGFETVEMQFLSDVRLLCGACRGQRFQPHVLAVTCRGVNVAQVLDLTVDETLQLFADAVPLRRALGPLVQLGLGYLRLGQPLTTLSGGEAQRLKLARVLGTRLKDTLFVVDEPSAGLHSDEVDKVLNALNHIVDGGGSVLAVEHDLKLVGAADWVVELGEGGGESGGRIVFEGTTAELKKADTLTGKALRSTHETALLAPQKAVAKQAGPALEVRGAREHTLKNVSVAIPHQALSVVTGPSGSGKSSLVFDVIFAEGQRRFLETLTPYARQFLPVLPKPEVNSVSGVPPSIALEQRTSRAGSNSTVATVTELAHYLRLIYAKLGTPHCPTHHLPIGGSNVHDVLAQLAKQRGKFTLLAPAIEARKGTHLEVFDAAARGGVSEARCDGAWVKTDDPPKLLRSKEHTIELAVARGITARSLTEEQVRAALSWGNGSLIVLQEKEETFTRYSTQRACPECGFAVPELDPRWFSFNTKQGMCPTCEGAGKVVRVVGRGKSQHEVEEQCSACKGTRLAPVPRNVKLHGEGYAELNQRSVAEFQKRLVEWRFSGAALQVAEPILAELKRRCDFLMEVGLSYLALGRAASSLSGGEIQRLRLAAQLGAGLTGALYVLDEPTIGLHPRDTQRLVANLRRLVELGSSVLVVEHDADVIAAADFLVDMGPSGGAKGGHIVGSGAPSAVLALPDSPTGQSLRVKTEIAPARRVAKNDAFLTIRGVSHNNLRSVSLKLAVGRFNVVAGVSGSGKSTLVRSVLLPAVRERLGLVTDKPGAFTELSDLQGLRRAVAVDQSPIGRTPRSVPATFLGIWDLVRTLFATSPEAQVLGFNPARFSFNTATGGRCVTCDGQGVITHEMSFLPDVTEVCAACNGQRFEPETLRVRFRGHSIGDILKLTAEEALSVFANHPKILAPLKTLVDLGAGYIQLGQGSHTLSGGEAQRLKLAAELAGSSRHEATLYVLDEPTTGLHQSDVVKLIAVLQRLVERGDTLVIIEHHPLLIASADYMVELGPEAGIAGGKIVAEGPPRDVSRLRTATAQVLRGYFE